MVRVRVNNIIKALFKVAQNSFLENGKIGNLIHIYGQIILDEKRESSYLHRMTSKEFGFFHESYVTAVAMTTMTFQNGGYFDNIECKYLKLGKRDYF